MKNDLRKNPRFVASEGIPAQVHINGKTLGGILLDFSSTGFAVVVSEELGQTSESSLEVEFCAQNSQTMLYLSARVVNQDNLSDQRIRLGCTITDMKHQSREYFSFLTAILGKQGFLKSMATKPVKCAGREAAS